MNAKQLLPLLTVFTLVGCNKNMIVKTDDEAKAIVAGILARQPKPELFEKPKTITAKQSSNRIHKFKDGYGEFSGTMEASVEYSIDVNSMKSISKTNLKYTGFQGKTEVIEFFDSNTSTFYTLTDANGYKTKTIKEGTRTEEAAKSYFAEQVSTTNYDNKSYLSSFETTLKEYQEKHEYYKNESDQHYNYTFGSNDAKSFQEILDIKTKIVAPETEKPAFNGYHTENSNMIMKNDRLEKVSSVTKDDTKSDKASFYDYTEETTKIEYSYDGVTISIPDLAQYETI